jgi:putative nucleotide binding protein
MQTVKEESAIVLDFLPNGYPFDSRQGMVKLPIGQALGKEYFTLLELIPKKGMSLQPNEEIYIGEGKRDKIHHIKGRMKLGELTQTAQTEIEFVIKDIVDKNEKKFVDFFNTAKPLTTRMHQIELLPGFGKKHMWQIIEEREIKPFESFEDLKQRVKLIPKPEQAIIKRILLELSGNEKHYLFTEAY